VPPAVPPIVPVIPVVDRPVAYWSDHRYRTPQAATRSAAQHPTINCNPRECLRSLGNSELFMKKVLEPNRDASDRTDLTAFPQTVVLQRRRSFTNKTRLSQRKHTRCQQQEIPPPQLPWNSNKSNRRNTTAPTGSKKAKKPFKKTCRKHCSCCNWPASRGLAATTEIRCSRDQRNCENWPAKRLKNALRRPRRKRCSYCNRPAFRGLGRVLLRVSRLARRKSRRLFCP